MKKQTCGCPIVGNNRACIFENWTQWRWTSNDRCLRNGYYLTPLTEFHHPVSRTGRPETTVWSLNFAEEGFSCASKGQDHQRNQMLSSLALWLKSWWGVGAHGDRINEPRLQQSHLQLATCICGLSPCVAGSCILRLGKSAFTEPVISRRQMIYCQLSLHLSITVSSTCEVLDLLCTLH